MAVYKRGNVWWYKFRFASRVIRESAKTKLKTLAKMAEAKRRRELEEGFNNLGGNGRAERVRNLGEVAEDYLEEYLLRHESDRFVAYAIGHITRHLGNTLLVDILERQVKDYQSARLKEGTAAKTINEEVGILLRLLGDAGEPIRARMRRHKTLKLRVRQNVGKAYSDAEKQKLIAAARQSRSLLIYPALTLALHTTMRDSETRNLTWGQTNLHKRFLTVGKSKSEAVEGRTIPLNSVALATLIEHSQWYLDRFGEIRPEWYVFPFGKPGSLNPTRPITTLKTAWNNVRERAGVKGRWHDLRHTAITDLAESGAGDQEIMDIAGHVSRQMLSRYSHIRMEAKRRALEAIATKTKSKEPIKDTVVEADHPTGRNLETIQ